MLFRLVKELRGATTQTHIFDNDREKVNEQMTDKSSALPRHRGINEILALENCKDVETRRQGETESTPS
jgi:hypothetical protein